MNMPTYQMMSRQGLTPAAMTQLVPAAFAAAPDAMRTSKHYTFINTAQVLSALIDAGFQPTKAQQMRVRGGGSADHARHMIRFSHVRDSITLVDAVPELVLINSHDGTSSYTLRAGLYRPVCTNGLLAQIGDYGLIHVAHRGNIVANVVEGALAITRGFENIGAVVERMHAQALDEREQYDFAAQAMSVRYHHIDHPAPITTDKLLLPRRAEDYGNSIWTVFNRVQENLITGGIHSINAKGRATKTRPIRAIREDVRVNAALWQHAMALLRP